MKTLKFVVVLWLLLLTTNFGVLPASATLSAAAKVSKREILTGEPLVLSVTFLNRGPSPILMWHSPDIGAALISKDGKTFDKFFDGLRPLGKRRPLTLNPGATVTSEFTICFRVRRGPQGVEGEYVFDEPGTFFVKGGYEDTTGVRTYSDPIEIKVSQPTGKDAEAWARVKNSESYGRLVQLSPDQLPQTALAELTGIAREYPESFYGIYIAEALKKLPIPSPAKTTSELSESRLPQWLNPISLAALLLAVFLGAVLGVLIWRRRHRSNSPKRRIA